MLTNLSKVGHAPSALFAERRLASFIGQLIRSDGHLGADLAHDAIDCLPQPRDTGRASRQCGLALVQP